MEGIRRAGYKTDFDFDAEDEQRLKIVKGAPIKDPRKR
jgi:hypothetical protein